MLLGESIQIKELRETIKQVAPTNISVLITGESGTGKEVVANEIYLNSKRKDKPFIKVNCGAIPEGIIESELFGHQKGAFTGAIETKAGYFQMADGGTIFLDEIGDLPLSAQVKILRVIETGEFMRVGGTKPSIVDVRIIAATNKDLAKEVFNGNFREDLYFRLKSINLHIPPLRERKIDIKILFDHFVKNFCDQNNIQFAGIDDDAMDYIINYAWLGNARELKNFCESIIVLSPNKKITLEDVKKHLQPEKTDKLIPQPIQFRPREQAEKDFLFRALLELKSDIIDIKNAIHELYIHNLKKADFVEPEKNGFSIEKEKALNMTIDDFEKEILTYLLREYKWDIDAVARQLKQTTRNIYIKIKKYNIDKRDFF